MTKKTDDRFERVIAKVRQALTWVKQYARNALRRDDGPAGDATITLEAPLRAAERYAFHPELCIVTCYFNPIGYATKETNLRRFLQPIVAAGLHCIVVEGVGDSGEVLDLPSVEVIRVQCEDVMWQKERLLNIGIQAAVERFPYVAWIDADILFCDGHWTERAVEALRDTYEVLQPFATAVRLPRDATEYQGRGEIFQGFGQRYSAAPECARAGEFSAHGHTGFAWVARSDMLRETLLYDHCITGGADHVMAHAFTHTMDVACMTALLGDHSPLLNDARTWATRKSSSARALGYVEGTVLHLWHGDTVDRRYLTRNQELAKNGFDPALDIRINESGCWEWTERGQALHQQWAREYFALRREDGQA